MHRGCSRKLAGVLLVAREWQRRGGGGVCRLAGRPCGL